MFEQASKKLGLDQAVLHDMGSPTVSAAQPKSLLDKKDIDALLKYGAYDLFKEDDIQKEMKFKEEDIDQILGRSSKVVWTDTEAREKQAGASSFSKATFQSSHSDSAIDVNDPNFWELVLPEAKTAENLMKKLDQGDIISTKEKRQTFMKDLNDLVLEVEAGFKEGKFEEMANTRNVLLTLFDKLKYYMSDFTDDQQQQIFQWSEEVRRPSRRERRQASRFSSSSDLLSIEDKGRAKDWKPRSSSDQPYPNWPDKERRKFHDAFMAYGLDRWKDIQIKAGLLDATEQQLRSYGEEFVKQCIVHADETERPIFIDFLTSILSPEQTLQIELKLKSDFTKLIKRKLRAWTRHIKLLQKLKDALGDVTDVSELADLEIPSSRRQLTKWWTEEEDRSLIIGMWKHGVGEYEAMRTDPELSFYKHLAVMEGQDAKRKKEGEEAEDQEEEEIIEEDETDAKKTKLTNAWPPNRTLEAQAKSILDTLSKKDSKRQGVKKDGKKRNRAERDSNWTKRELNDFRINLFVYGAGNWDRMRMRAGLRKTNEQIEVRSIIHLVINPCSRNFAI
jgi:hypothetical protein